MRLVDRRIGFLFGVFLVLIAAGAGRAAYLGVVKGNHLQRVANGQQESDIVIPARRGSITDVRGTELAVSQPAVDIAVTPYFIKDKARFAEEMARIVETPETTILRAISRDTGFAYIGRKVPSDAADRVKKLAKELKVDGITYIPQYRRVYPRDWMASQLLGGVYGDAGNGSSGLEYELDSSLKGTAGERRLVKDALGDPIRMRDTKPGKPGEDVSLSIDANIQGATEDALADVGRTYKPRGATAIVMNPQTGAVLALANWPQVNANDAAGAPDYAAQNRATGATYEPGSTFKAITVAGALEDKKVTPETQFELPVNYAVADRVIHDAEERGPETASVSKILSVSSNVGAVKIGQELGKDELSRWIDVFGFGKKTGVDLPGEEQGIVLAPKKWSLSTIGNVPIGQGIAVTPMQMAQAYSAIANGGILRAPHVVDAVGGKARKLPTGRRVISAATAASLRDMLEGVLGPGGTATGAQIKGYKLAGKTGTAEKAVAGGYSKDKYVASFVGFAPADHPKLLTMVMVDEPKGDIFGGAVAAPAWRKITSFALNYLKIPPD